MFDLFISLHPLVLIFFCLCVLACVFVSLHPHILRFMHPCLHPCMLIFSGSVVLTCNLVSHILISLRSCTLCAVGILTSSHSLILRFMYSGWFLVYSHSHTLISKIFSVRNCLGNWNQIKIMVTKKKSGIYGSKSCIYCPIISRWKTEKYLVKKLRKHLIDFLLIIILI